VVLTARQICLEDHSKAASAVLTAGVVLTERVVLTRGWQVQCLQQSRSHWAGHSCWVGMDALAPAPFAGQPCHCKQGTRPTLTLKPKPSSSTALHLFYDVGILQIESYKGGNFLTPSPGPGERGGRRKQVARHALNIRPSHPEQ